MTQDEEIERVLICLTDDGHLLLTATNGSHDESRGGSDKDIMVFSSRPLAPDQGIELFWRAHEALAKRYRRMRKAITEGLL